MTHVVAILADLLRYGLLSAISVGVGLAIIRLLGVSLPRPATLTLAPAVALSWWSVVLGFGVSCGVPVRTLAAPVWIASLALAAYGMTSHAREIRWSEVRLVAFTTALPVLVLLPYFLFGLADYPGSGLPDGWAYVALGQYLWTYPVGMEGGLSPLYQFGAHLAHVRHVAGAMLGFFSPLVAWGDTQAPGGLFLAWALFVFSMSCAFFALCIRLRPLQFVTYLALVVVSGWIANLVWANNYDNALALSFAPVLAGLIEEFNLDARGWRVLLGGIGAGLFYVYPELAAIIATLAAFAALDRWRRETTPLKRWGLVAVTSATFALALTWPFVPDMVAFIGTQTSAGLQAAGRPGEGMFAGLLSRHYQPSAFWGLGGEFQVLRFLSITNAIGILLSVLAALGLFRLLRSRQAGVAAWVILLIAAALAMILVERYSYGAYKLILLAWWGLALAVVLGLDTIVRWSSVRSGARAAPTAVCVLVMVATIGAHAVARNLHDARRSGKWSMADYRRVGSIADLGLSKKVVIAVDERVANEWAVYFLRHMPVKLGAYRMYMAFPHIRPLMERARSVAPSEIGYVLTDDHPEAAFRDLAAWSLVWSAGPYRLWAPKAQTWSILTGVTNPYGLETVGGKPFFWMGPSTSTIDVINSADGVLGLNAAFIPGPSAAGATRTVLVSTASGYSREVIVHGGDHLIQVPVKGGTDQIRMTLQDAPTLAAPNGDTRALLMGVQDLGVSLGQDRVALQRVDNRNGLEEVGGLPFFWMGNGDTLVTLAATEAGRVRLTADFVPGPSVSNGTTRHLLVITGDGPPSEVTVEPGPSSIPATVQAGENRVLLRPLDRPDRSTTGAGDRRPLIIGVRDLKVQFDDRGDSGASIERIDNANGTEQVDGRPFFWIGGRGTVITVRAPRAGELLLSGRFVSGPSLTSPANRRLLVATDRGAPQTLSIPQGDYIIRASIPSGKSRVMLTALDAPDVLKQPNGDTRPLLLGVSGLTATLGNALPPAPGRHRP